jgi:hypothetical protein
MSVSLTYYTLTAVPQQLVSQMQDEANALPHRWWSEGIHFFQDPTGANRAYGDTKLFLLAHENEDGDLMEVEPENDSAMAWRDASFIVERLEEWTREFGVAWELVSAGELAGRIEYGQRDATLAELLAAMREFAELSEPLTEERLARIAGPANG